MSLSFDAKALAQRVMALAQNHAQANEARKAIVGLLSEVLTFERQHAEKILLGHKSGLHCVS